MFSIYKRFIGVVVFDAVVVDAVVVVVDVVVAAVVVVCVILLTFGGLVAAVAVEPVGAFTHVGTGAHAVHARGIARGCRWRRNTSTYSKHFIPQT